VVDTFRRDSQNRPGGNLLPSRRDAIRKQLAAKQLLAGLLVILYSYALFADEGHHPLGSNQNLGVVSFSTSCAKASQKAIEHGIALLHSFLFNDAEDQFKAAASEDSACAMAYWAQAIGLYRPLAYRPTDSDMKQGWELVEKAQTLPPKTQRERDYVEALAVFYRADQRDYETRNRQYSEAMEKVYKELAPQPSRPHRVR